ncbi:hypothetical protein ES705_29230 [subsurface metagenome]
MPVSVDGSLSTFFPKPLILKKLSNFFVIYFQLARDKPRNPLNLESSSFSFLPPISTTGFLTLRTIPRPKTSVNLTTATFPKYSLTIETWRYNSLTKSFTDSVISFNPMALYLTGIPITLLPTSTATPPNKSIPINPPKLDNCAPFPGEPKPACSLRACTLISGQK